MRKRTHKTKQEHKIRPGQAQHYGSKRSRTILCSASYLVGQTMEELRQEMRLGTTSTLTSLELAALLGTLMRSLIFPSEQCSLPLLPSAPSWRAPLFPTLAMLLPHDHPSQASLTSLKFRCGLGF